MFTQAVDASAGGAFLGASGQGQRKLAGARLAAGADAATMTIREGSGAGRILAKLGAAAGLCDEFRIPVMFSGNVHVTLTGTAPVALLYEA
jgi:hypothetical protein